MAIRELTIEEAEDAKRLRDIWAQRKDELHLSQVKAAKALGYNSQGAISQYLNGKVGLNFAATAKFAKLLRVQIEDISPRFGKLVEKPTAPALDAYIPPVTNLLAGNPSAACLNWFAFHKDFCAALGVPGENLKLVRLDDDSFTGITKGSVLLVDDRYQTSPTNGIYLLQLGEAVVARQITVGNDLVISSGSGKNQTLNKDSFGMLRIIGRVIALLSTLSNS